MKGRRKKIQHVFVYFVMLGMSAFLIMGGMRQLAMTHELRTSINQKQKEKKALSSKNLTNPDYVEYIARGKYLVTKEGEQVFKFPSKDN